MMCYTIKNYITRLYLSMYIGVLMHVYLIVGQDKREQFKQYCRDLLTVHFLECGITLGVLLGVFIYAWVLTLGYVQSGEYLGGLLLGGSSMGLPWVMRERYRLWRRTMKVMA